MKKKKLLIDLGKLKARYSGLGEMSYNFGKNLVANIELLKDANIETYFLVPEKYIGAFGNEIKYVRLNFFSRHVPFLQKKYDAWYASHQDSGYMPANKSTKYFLTIHDLNVAYHAEKKKAQKRLNEIQKKLNRADLITVNSFFTKREVTEKLSVNADEVRVVYCGSEDFSKMKASKPKELSEHDSFYLHISTITPKKNTKALVEMMKLMPDKKLVIAGSWDNGYAKEILNDIIKNDIKNIICLNKVDNEEKAWLYQHCTALFFPSLLEGFGLPVIEAMYCGKPVFCSTCTSLPEIGSDKAYYWNTFDPQIMKQTVEEKMLLFKRDESKQGELKAYADEFNWTKNILQYIQLFKDLINS